MLVKRLTTIIEIRNIPARVRGVKLVFILVVVFIINAPGLYAQSDTTEVAGIALADSLGSDSLAADTLLISSKKSFLESEVNYQARDSIINDVVGRKVFLFGEALITYQDIRLEAERIVYDFSNYTVHAEGVQDTSEVWQGLPVFEQGESKFDAFSMDYNFKTKKAYVKRVQTQVVEGTLTGDRVKTVDDNNVIYIRKGEYCPCEDPQAKTRFRIGKLKVIKDKQIVTGPGYLAVGKVPTPLVFPFGFFPNAEKKQAGLIFPSYGNARELGYFLSDLGFYMPVNDYVDTKFLVDIYSRGSYGFENITRYKKRYKYDGSFNVEYNVFKRGDPDLLNFSEERNFFVTWRHAQDRKAHPLSNFSADVNAGSSRNFQNNINASQNDYLSNTFRSNIRYQRSFYNSAWSLNLNAGHDQNSNTGTYNFTLPEVNVNKARTFPLKDLFNNNPKQSWYEKIGWTYSMSFRNTLTVDESDLALNNWERLRRDFRNGIRHNTAFNTSFKAGAVSINPALSYTERWHFRSFGRTFNEETDSFEADTIQGFNRNYDWSFSTTMTTKLYGMYTFRGKKLKAIRHTLTPSIGYSFRPDFDSRVFGFFGNDGAISSYDPYQGLIYGGPPRGRSQSINFSFVNNIEAKILNRRDTTSKFTKLALLENLTLSGSYNFAADSLRLSSISLNGFTSISKYADLRFSALFDPYSYVLTETGSITRVNTYFVDQTGKLASFESGNIAVNARGLGSSMFKPREKGPVIEAEDDDAEIEDRESSFLSGFRIPWNFSFQYALNVRRVRFTESSGVDLPVVLQDSLALTQSLQFNGDFTFFDKVRVSFTSGYDFTNKELTPTTFLVNVDLNCWELSARIIPFGFRRSYSVSLNIKSSMLRDLKLERNRSFSGDENFFL